MQMLRAAGIDPDRMKLVLLRDLAANADHAFLLVQTGAGKLVLDNVTDRLTDGSRPNAVRPVLSFSVNRRWVHAYRGAQPSPNLARSEEHTSELQSLMRNSYATFCLNK